MQNYSMRGTADLEAEGRLKKDIASGKKMKILKKVIKKYHKNYEV